MENNDWLERRSLFRVELYGEVVARPPSLGELALSTDSKQIRDNATLLCHTYYSVRNIMEAHNNAALSGQDGLFALIDPNDVSRVAMVASRTIVRWEKLCRRIGTPSLFPRVVTEEVEANNTNDPEVQRVIELGSAVLETVQYGMPFYSEDETNYGELLSYIYRRGPEYTRRWVQKTAIREYCASKNIECDDALEYIPLNRLKRLALDATRDPEGNLARKIVWFNELTPERIAQETGWSIDEANEVFSRRTLMLMCLTIKASPLERVKEIAQRIDTELTPYRIATELGWPEDRSARVFSRSFILRVAKKHPDAMGKIRRIANLLDTDLSVQQIATKFEIPPQDADKIFTECSLRDIAFAFAKPMQHVKRLVVGMNDTFSLAKLADELGISVKRAEHIFVPNVRHALSRRAYTGDKYVRAKEILQVMHQIQSDYGIRENVAHSLACYNSPPTAHSKAAIVKSELSSKPPDVSDSMWMSVVSVLPYGTHEERLNRLQAIRDVYMVLSLNSGRMSVDPQEEEWRFNEASNDYSVMPRTISFEPSQNLLEIARKAGISEYDIKQLLLFFGNSEACELEDEQASSLVEKIKQASAQG